MPRRGKHEMCWHIVDYIELFKALNANRTYELEQVQYTQRHLAAPFDKPAVQRHINRMGGLMETLGFMDYLVAKELYERLLDRSQLQRGEDKYLRGYVVDERLRPATAGRIAALVRMPLPAAAIEKGIKHLHKVGLIEHVPLPDKPAAPAPQPQPEPPASPPQTPSPTAPAPHEKPDKTTPAPAKPRRKTAAQKDLDEGRRRLAGTSQGLHHEVEREKERERESDPRPSASVEKEKEITRPSASLETDPKTEGDADAEPESTADGPNGTLTRNANAKPTQTGTDAESDADSGEQPDPDSDDDGQRDGQTCQTHPRPTGPTGTEPGGTVNLASVIERLYDPSGYQFAAEVYQAIGVRLPKDSPGGRAEIEAFASAWQRASKAGLTPSALNDLWSKGIHSARQLERKKARGYRFRKSAEATWMHTFFQRLDAVKRESVRASTRVCKVL
jgi:hypothetical protein